MGSLKMILVPNQLKELILGLYTIHGFYVKEWEERLYANISSCHRPKETNTMSREILDIISQTPSVSKSN